MRLPVAEDRNCFTTRLKYRLEPKKLAQLRFDSWWEKSGTISNAEKRNHQYKWVLSDPPHKNDSFPASDMVCQVETASRSDHIP